MFAYDRSKIEMQLKKMNDIDVVIEANILPSLGNTPLEQISVKSLNPIT
jgi:hypothetical protein